MCRRLRSEIRSEGRKNGEKDCEGSSFRSKKI